MAYKDFKSQYSEYQNQFEVYFKEYFAKIEHSLGEYYLHQLNQIKDLSATLDFQENYSENYKLKVKAFLKSLKYSCFSGGKRFRPILTMAVADMFGHINSEILTYAASVEMIHTYSLIHDDLPCMDNDDFRRGEPTNHKVYGEATALLAGDALLTLAFENLSENLAGTKNMFLAQKRLADAAGFRGMVSGQYVDIEGKKTRVSKEELLLIQLNKTGALIRASILGAADLISIQEADKINLDRYSILLGLAFQIKDDILDYQKLELSMPSLLGLEKTKEALTSISQKAIDAIHDIPKCDFLISLVEYNLKREK